MADSTVTTVTPDSPERKAADLRDKKATRRRIGVVVPYTNSLYL